ncbi:MAG: putative RND efflux membrane fusion protein [Anaerolineae bacterium]|mgnify:CR=1 FL=1|nr:MAG: putative RND efflux membrane fusion protein [Anaerolineae bacterium]
MVWFRKLFLSLTIIFLFSLSACSTVGQPTASQSAETEIPPVKTGGGIITEGKVIPKSYVQLSFQVSGKVSEILVKEGDSVKTGDVLVRLGNRAEAEAELARAELELLNAQQALNDLIDNHPIEKARALEAVAQANDRVRSAKYQLDNFTIPQSQQNLDAVEAVKLMEERLDQARLAFEPYKNDSLLNDARQKLKEALDNAQSDYNAAVKRLNYEVQLEAAKADLEKALDHWEKIKNGPDPDQLALAKARINAAEMALRSAQARLENLELKATIDGNVAKIDLVVGSQVTPNTIVVTLADFSSWYVYTENLTEIEVVEIQENQSVTIVPDALPELVLTGTVESIGQVFEVKQGDITYTTKILLNESDPRLRWGMTVLVTFQK